ESGGMKFGRKACYFFHSGVLLFRRNDWIPELRPECSAEFTGMECGCVFGIYYLFTSLLLPNKHITLPSPHLLSSSPPPPFVTTRPPWLEQR
ncbi:hypothetical protein K443DRAFT_117824, partial [Laccaria amethystina LaAM-08-1]